MDYIDFFPGNLISQFSSDSINRQDYFSKLLSNNKNFQHFNHNYMSFCKMQENDTSPSSTDCLLFKGICSSMFRPKTSKIVTFFSIFFSFSLDK